MNSTKYIVIQTALRPMSVAVIEGTDFHFHEVADFQEFFDVMAKSAINADTHILVNRGPGSYSGIRTGISYVYGLMNGGLLKKDRMSTFTSFDFVRAATNHQQAIFLKAWPRVTSGKLEGSKGYFEKSGEQLYKSWEDIADENNLLIVGEEKIETQHEYRRYADLIKDPIGYRELINKVEQLGGNLEPLYINPVHIT